MSKHRPPSAPPAVTSPEDLEYFTQDRGIVKGPFPSAVDAWDSLRANDDGRPHQLAQVWPQRRRRA